ncbi:hypothetical protein TNCV_3937171 [Trichonephila clavipes]|nr:hypothetical protein TNCV_3937171 [Trichonephila clavipes]
MDQQGFWWPYIFLRQKPSLKELAEDYLQNSIQDSTKGHDCVESAPEHRQRRQKPKLGTPYTPFPVVVSRSTQASSPISVSSVADAHYEVFKHRIDEIIKEKNLRENEDKENETPIVFMPTLMLSQNYTNATNFQPCGQRFVY